MTRSSWVIAGTAAGVAAVLLAGAWLLLGERETGQAGDSPSGVAATTVLSEPPDPSDGSRPPNPYPTVPSAQVRGDQAAHWTVRTDGDGDGNGERLLVQLMDTECSGEELRLLGEHRDRVEVEIRMVVKPPPPGVSVDSDGSYGCMGYSQQNGPYAVIDLHEPLGDRTVVIHRGA